jgi:hypothetical protein
MRDYREWMRPPTRIGLTILAIIAGLILAGCPSGTPTSCPSGSSNCDNQPAPGGGY